MKLLMMTVAALSLYAIAAIALIYPKRFQDIALRYSQRMVWWPTNDWMKTPSYILSVRLSGAIALLMGSAILWTVILLSSGNG
jgi:hypothetical protein